MTTDREPPIAVFLFAASYFQAAQHLQESYEMDRLELRFDAPIYYLYCHSLELTMKAYLRARGLKAKELATRKYGHQLLALWQACQDNGLHGPSVSADYVMEQVIEILDPYAREFEFRYIKVGAKALPSLEDVKSATGRLLGMVKPSIPMPPGVT